MEKSIEERITSVIRTIPDYPKPNIQFKDITPLFIQPELCKSIVDEMSQRVSHLKFDVIAGLETRGYLFGYGIAAKLNKSFLLIRKAGKLPGKTKKKEYSLEYGTAAIEVQEGLIPDGSNVLIHDDLLATGGTALAAAELIHDINCNVSGFLFLIELEELKGKNKLEKCSDKIYSIVKY